MKKLLLLSAVLFVTAVSFAQAPQAFKYQAVARDASGIELVNAPITVRATIHDFTAGGAVVYQETFSVTTNPFGLFSINVGQGSVVSGDFSTISWGTGDKYLQQEVNFGSGYQNMGTSQLLSVPFALYSANGTPGPQGPQGPTGATGATGPQGPAGTMANGSAPGNTPYWDGSAWVVNSSNIFNNGGNVGIKTSTPSGTFHIDNTSVATDNLLVTTSNPSGGRAAKFQITNSGNGSDALQVFTNGTGKGARVEITNPSNTSDAIYSTTDGSGSAIRAVATGIGSVGYFSVNNASHTGNAFAITTNGSADNALYVLHTGGGPGGYYQLNSATNASAAIDARTNGTGNAGSFIITNISNTSAALTAATNGTGPAAQFNGAVKIVDGTQGAGKVLVSDANGTASWQSGVTGPQGPAGPTGPQGPTGATGFLSAGSASGNTPYWSGSDWVVNNSNIYNFGGNVGIGTTSPGAKLEINGSVRFGYNTWHTSRTDGANRFLFDGATHFGSPGGYDFRSSSDVNIFTMNNSGAVGLQANTWHTSLDGKNRLFFGTNDRTYFGSANGYTFRNAADNVDIVNIDNNGNLCATSYTNCSDIRYKKDFSPLANALSNVMKLKGLNYYWRTNEFPEKGFTNEKQIGFIAQDLEKLYPQLVVTDANGYKSVDYARLTPVLVEAMKEQQRIIENQSSEIQKLKAENKAQEVVNKELKTDIGQIKAALGLGL